MMTDRNISIAIPWSLSHYIPLNGFHPLYFPLFNHTPPGVILNAWDNVKFHELLLTDGSVRSDILSSISSSKNNSHSKIDRKYQDYFSFSNQVLTSQLPGAIEFHHTALFPSLKRPFVFHCESFAPIFFPFSHQGSGSFSDQDQLRNYYHNILKNPLCLGIFSHIPETLQNIREFFKDPIIDSKLFPSRIGFDLNSAYFKSKNAEISNWKFIFINSANQNPKNFFKRGGHIVLKFWERFRYSGRQGLLVMRCAKPDNSELESYGVNIQFIASENSKSILWIEDYLTNSEMNALFGDMHFFLLLSNSLHSVSIMQAMANGVVPVITDTVGTSHYITDIKNGIVLKGMREALWYRDPTTGILIDKYHDSNAALDRLLLDQLWQRITELLDNPGKYHETKHRVFKQAKDKFSGSAFSNDFWEKVLNLYSESDFFIKNTHHKKIDSGKKVYQCLIQKADWPRLFGSPTQPFKRINLGLNGVVYEYGGAFVFMAGNPKTKLSDWSVFARYFDDSAPKTLLKTWIEDFGGLLKLDNPLSSHHPYRFIIQRISKLLMPFPVLYGFAWNVLRKLRQYNKLTIRYREYIRFKRLDCTIEPDVELIMEKNDIKYNIVRFYHRYYAFPQSAGAFNAIQAASGGYRALIWKISPKGIEDKIEKILIKK